ncbi:DUF998 domain-containing protein [Amorphoplanes digitatis]|uniref:DUF998 domain-containing protein n=1 Tax=Actinoplanes digitatis TaxID=1868 RepID=A0A7W7HTE5_9ACTN|nr:DUF998 domain-containing protein [Actinoplanes digitatis]MBB4760405.1 hypothetical protein [Actinoplanes digitatis]GID95362.1 hypothetical protein Adi01nite_47740 [Actinoplanes digitatis]
MPHRTVPAAWLESPAAERGQGGSAVAAVAGCASLVGVLIMLFALVAAPGSWLLGYISEAGTPGLPLAAPYRAGLVLLAAGAGLLGLALRRRSRLLAPLLGAAAFAATSGVVPCSSGCPLPPFEPTTAGDVVHAAATIVAAVLALGAMVTVALCRALRPAVRRLATAAAALIVPLGAALGAVMLLAGRGPASATLERLVVLVGVGWIVGTSLLTALAPDPA